MKIYTRRGDAGETDLFAGGRVSKDHLRVEAYGAVDELSSSIGRAAADSGQADVRALCQTLQDELFELGAYLATPDASRRQRSGIRAPRGEAVAALEESIDRFEQELPPLRRFILPGGCPAAAGFHVARTVCRRAERRVVALHRQEALAESALRYLNRLSDLLFVLARLENLRGQVHESEWRGPGG